MTFSPRISLRDFSQISSSQTHTSPSRTRAIAIHAKYPPCVTTSGRSVVGGHCTLTTAVRERLLRENLRASFARKIQGNRARAGSLTTSRRMKMMDLAPQASPVFPQAVYSRAEVSNEPGTGYLLASQASSRQFFCPADDSHVQQTQFSGSVSRVYEIESQDAREDEDLEEVLFGGKLLRYCLSRPLALKTCRIAVLKLEAQWQRCAMGELVGEVSIDET